MEGPRDWGPSWIHPGLYGAQMQRWSCWTYAQWPGVGLLRPVPVEARMSAVAPIATSAHTMAMSSERGLGVVCVARGVL
jgi:hypothetical protein